MGEPEKVAAREKELRVVASKRPAEGEIFRFGYHVFHVYFHSSCFFVISFVDAQMILVAC